LKKSSPKRNQLSETKTFRWLVLGIIIAVYFVAYFHRVSASVMAPDLTKTFGVSGTMLGLMASAYFYSYAIAQPVVGVFVDRWKPRKVVPVCALLMGLGSIVFALAPNFLVAFIGRVIIGMGAGGAFVPIIWFVSRWFSPNERTFAFSLMMVGGNAGAIVAAGPLGALIAIVGWRSATLMIAVIAFILALLVWIIVRDESKGVPSSKKEGNFSHLSNLKKSPAKMKWLSILKVTFSESIVRYLSCAALLSYGALMAFQGLWGVPFLIDAYGFSKIAASNMIMILPVGFIVGSLILAKLFNTRFGNLIFIIGFIIPGVIYFILMITVGRLTPFALFSCIFILGFLGGVFPFSLKIYSEILPQANFGAAMGIVNSTLFFGGMVFQPLTGFIFDIFGRSNGHYSIVAYKYFFLFLTIALVIAAISAFKAIHKFRKNK